jgi:ADP-heptose:LPS heptosyltransferase
MASLLYHAGALGDFITTLPAMSVWRRLHPQERIVLLGKPGFAALLSPAQGPAAWPRASPFDEAWDAEAARFSSLFSAEPSSALSPLFSRFTSALLFCPGSSPLPANLRRLGTASIVRQDPFPSVRMPAIEHHLSLFAGVPRIPFEEEERVPCIRVPTDAAPEPRGAVALHPGSGSPVKNWPFDRFVALGGLLRSAGERVVWVLGPAEEGTALPEGERAWKGLALASLAAGLACSRLFVGNDSGVAHLAAATGCPTVALFGASDPEVWAPRGHIVKILHGSGMRAITLESVARACLTILAE